MMNIEVKIEGTTPTHDLVSTMFVGNHISWLDIHVLNSIRAVRFIAKSEIRKWPIFGWLAKQTNTLFIEREQKKDALRVIDKASKSLTKGDCLCFFPEGTTTDGKLRESDLSTRGPGWTHLWWICYGASCIAE